MLIALLKGHRIVAARAERGPEYVCPGCGSELILRKGRKVIHHFAHKPPVSCAWGNGETQAHLKAKAQLARSFSDRDIRSEVEFVVSTPTGTRRADVMAWKPNGISVAFELQHTSITLDEIEARALAYAEAGIAQIWIPFLPPSVWARGHKREEVAWFVPRYAARPFERWVHGFDQKAGMWMYDPREDTLWNGRLAKHRIYLPPATWYSTQGEDRHTGGYWKQSARYQELTLTGPYSWNQLRVQTRHQNAVTIGDYRWPKGMRATFVAADNTV